MKPKAAAAILIGLTTLILFTSVFNRYIRGGPRSPLIGFRSEIQNAYDEIKIGDTLSQVTERLGAPRRTGDSLLLPQFTGFEDQFKEAEKSNAQIYYLWINGGNWFYSIGFDSDGRVAIKAKGHS